VYHLGSSLAKLITVKQQKIKNENGEAKAVCFEDTSKM
jgi:hypothetical protein